MFTKKIFSLLGLLFIGNRIGSVFADECNVENPKDCISNAYYLVNKQDYSLISSSGASGSLYYCSGEETKTCKEKTGVGYYFIDPETVYVCTIDNGALQCTKESIPATRNACTKDNIGKLFVKTGDSTASLCLNYVDTADPADAASVVELNGSTKGNYLVYKNSNPIENVFGITGSNEKYAIVGIQDKVVNLNSTYGNGLKYVYVDSTKNRVMEKGDKDFPKLTGSTNDPDEGNIMELLCSSGKCKNSDAEVKVNSFTGFSNQEGIYLLKIDEATTTVLTNSNIDTQITDALDKVGLYNCDKELNCERVAGYAWNTEKTKVYKIPASGSAEDISESADTSHADSYCTGRLGLVYTLDSAKKICMEDGVGVDIEANKYYIFGDTAMDSSSPFLSVNNKILKMTADYAVIDDNFKAENNKNYVIKIGDKFYSYKYDESKSGFLRDSELSGVKNYNLHGTGLNIYDEYPLKDTKSISAAVASWKLFNCKYGECLQTYGYMKSQNEKKYFKYYADGTTENAILKTGGTGFTPCTSDGENGLMSDGKLCITHGSDSTRVTGEMANGNLFVVHTANGDPFYNTSPADLLLEATSNSITISNIYEGRSGILTHKNQKILSSSITENTEGNYEKLILYDCEKTGSCNRVGGYAINGNKVYSVLKTDEGSKSSIKYNEGVISEVDACSSTYSGKIVKIGTDNHLCLDNTNKVKLTDYGYYALGNNNFNSGSPFDSASDKKKMIKITGDLIAFDHAYDEFSSCVIKNGENYIAYDQTSKTFIKSIDTGIYLYDKDDSSENVFVSITSPADVTNNNEIQTWTLFDCTEGNCEPTYGYYKPGQNYLSITHTGSNKIYTTDDIKNNPCAGDSDVGNLLKDGKLCILPNENTALQVKAEMAAKDYLLSNANDSIFAAAHANKNIVVKGTNRSFTLKHLPRFNVQGIDANTHELGAVNYQKLAEVAILKCIEDHTCEKVNGYSKNTNDDYYSVDKSTGAALVTLAEGTCTNTQTGTIVLKEGTKIFCIGSGGSLQVPEVTGQYVVGNVATTSKLTSNKLISFNTNYIVVNDEYEGNTNANYLIKFGSNSYVPYSYTSTSGAYSIDGNLSGMKTYQKVGETNLYREVNVSQMTKKDLPSLNLLKCGGGKCIELTGYILVSGEIYKCSSGDCSNAAPEGEILAADGCDNASKVGKVAKTTTTPSKIQLCMAGTTPAFASLDGSEEYYTGAQNTAIKKYLGNANNNIIGIPVPEMGYFLVSDNKLSTSGDIIRCDGSENCSKETNFVASTCTADDIGKFRQTTKKLCLDAEKESDAIGTTGSYIINFGSNNVFKSVLKTSSYALAIKMDDKSITVDTSRSSICVSDTTLAFTAKSGACASGTKEYSCNNTGLCTLGASVSSNSLKSCTGLITVDECTHAGTIKNYCIDTTNKIHGINTSNECADTISGVKLLNIFDPAAVKLIDFSTGIINTEEAENLVLYQCSASGCEKRDGYVKISKTYTEVKIKPDGWDGIYNNGSYFGDNDGTDTAATQTWTPPVYLKKSDEYYLVSKTGGGVSTGGAFASTCTSANAGKLNSSTGKVCTSDGVTFDFGNNEKHLVTTGSAQWYIESNSDYVFRTQLSGSLVNGGNLINTASLEIVNYTQKTNEQLVTDKTNLVLYNCDITTKKLCKLTSGFLKSSNGVFSITTTADSGAAVTTGYACTNDANKVGTLITDKSKLCVEKAALESDSVTAGFSDGYYLVTGADASSPFNGLTNGIIKTSTSALIHDNLYPDGIYLKTIHGKIDEFAAGDCTHDTKKAYVRIIDCTDGVCTPATGYAFDNNKYYGISTTGDAAIIDNALSESSTNCGSDVGEVGTFSGKTYLCLDTSESVELVSDNYGSYVIGTISGNSKLDSSKLVTITEKFIYVDTKVTGASDPVYVIKIGDKYKNYQLNTGGGTFSAYTAADKYVYQVVEGHSNVFKEVDLANVSSASDLEGAQLFNCDDHSVCTEKNGYIVAGTGASENIYSNLNGGWSAVTLISEESCNAASIEGVTLSSHYIKLCMPTAIGAASVDVDGDVTYMFGKTASSYKIYKGNASTNSNIVFVENPVVGYYMTKATGEIEKETTAMTSDLLVTCVNSSGISCTTTVTNAVNPDNAGYYLDNAKSNSIIQCTANTNCQLLEDTSLQNKSFVLHSGVLISCNNDKICSNPTTENNDKYVVKVGEDYKIFSSDGTKLTLVQSANIETYNQDATYTTLFKLVNLSSTDPTNATKLFDCKANGSCKETFGYYKPTSGRFLKICKTPGNNAVVASGITACDNGSAGIGLLLSNGKLCAKGSGEGDIEMPAESKKYIIGTVSNSNIFTEAADAAIILKATAKSFTLDLDNSANTNYCKDTTSNEATLKGDGDCGSGAGCCGTDGKCTAAACA